jgi:hypothetical protein
MRELDDQEGIVLDLALWGDVYMRIDRSKCPNGNSGCTPWDGIHAPDDSMCEPCKESLAVGLDALDYM